MCRALVSHRWPAIVNALQLRATVVVRSSLREGFGLTVTEATWKRHAELVVADPPVERRARGADVGVLADQRKQRRRLGAKVVAGVKGWIDRTGQTRSPRGREQRSGLPVKPSTWAGMVV